MSILDDLYYVLFVDGEPVDYNTGNANSLLKNSYDRLQDMSIPLERYIGMFEENDGIIESHEKIIDSNGKEHDIFIIDSWRTDLIKDRSEEATAFHLLYKLRTFCANNNIRFGF